MYFKLKLTFVVCFTFFLLPFICQAKTISIDDISYQVLDVLELDGLKYDAKNDTLTLTNANLKTIKTSENLNIVIIGDNYLTNDNITQIALSAKNIEITGNGKLTIESNNSAIFSEKITINRTNLKIKSKQIPFSMLSSCNHDFICNNSNLEIETENEIFNIRKGNIYLNNSIVKIIKSKEILNTYTKNLYINNTDFTSLESLTMSYNNNQVYIYGNSYVKIKTTNNSFFNQNYQIGDNLSISSSSDDKLYEQAIPNKKDTYIKIYNLLDDELLKEREFKLSEQEKLLQEKEKIINQDLENINLIKNQLEIKQKELDDLSLSLEIKSETLNQEENRLKEAERKQKIDLETINKEKDNLNLLRFDLEQSQIIIKQHESKIKEDLSLLEEWENNLQIKDNLLLKKEEELDVIKNNLENCNHDFNFIENPKTYDKFYLYCFILLISLIGIFSLIKLKKIGGHNG